MRLPQSQSLGLSRVGRPLSHAYSVETIRATRILTVKSENLAPNCYIFMVWRGSSALWLRYSIPNMAKMMTRQPRKTNFSCIQRWNYKSYTYSDSEIWKFSPKLLYVHGLERIQCIMAEIFYPKYGENDDATAAKLEIHEPPPNFDDHISATNHSRDLKFWIFPWNILMYHGKKNKGNLRWSPGEHLMIWARMTLKSSKTELNSALESITLVKQSIADQN